jgi:ABC-2 type transport system ATP-binding protein
VRIEIEGLSKHFGSVAALRDVGCEIPSGRRVALVGPNGSGKSTFNRVLMGLVAFEGHVLVGGASPLAGRVEIARRVAYVPQLAPNLGAPVAELVRALATIRGIEVDAIAKRAARLDLDLEGVARRPFRGLSGGTKQKLVIALALAADASLYILDEPTGSLDARSRARFFPLFDEIADDATLILCSHRLEEVRQLVEHVLVLDEGRLVYDGPAEAFLEASTRGVLEVSVREAAADDWLRARGFRRGTGSWWVRDVDRPEKRALVDELVRRLGPDLLDLNVRDLESLDLEGGDGAA